MNTGIAMTSKGSGIIVEISPRLLTGSSHILAELATAWWPFSAHRLVLNVGTFPLLKKSALTLIVTKPNYYTKVEKSFRAMNVYLSPACGTRWRLSAQTALHCVNFTTRVDLDEDKWRDRLLTIS